MAWIESHQELGQHPKTKKLARLLDVKLPTAVGYLHFIWWWALNYAQDGSLDRYEAADIADAAVYDGDPQRLLDALINSGYIDKTDEGLVLHDWDEYAGKLLEKRARDRERKHTATAEARRTGDIPQTYDGDPQRLLDALINSGYIDKTDEGLVLHDWDEYAGKLLEKRARDRERKHTATAEARRTGDIPQTSDGTPTERARLPNVHNQPTIPNQPNQPNQTKPTVPNQTNPAPSATVAETFEAFWKEYPKKVGKAKCSDVWKRLKPKPELFEKIMTALRAQKQTQQWTKENGAYIPNPLTWLNQRRWEDEPVEIKPEGGASANGRSKKSEPAVTGFHAAE